MPSYLDFESTKNFRNTILGKTLKNPQGPLSFNATNYAEQKLSNLSNVKSIGIDGTVEGELVQSQNMNVYKPDHYFIKENLDTIPRKANLSLYPYFVQGDYSLVSILSTNNYDTESELQKFASTYIKNSVNGPFYSRIAQNTYKNTLGRVRVLDALNGNTSTAINIITGREPLVESNYSITVDNSLTPLGIASKFIQTVSGLEVPFSIIPGQYLSDPANPVNYRPEAKTGVGKLYQDVTGTLGSLIGIERRPKTTSKPSDNLIKYMGSGQKNRLFNLLTFNTYAPNYTTTARSQQSTKLFTFADKIAQGAKSIAGVEAPRGQAYIGDDRGDNVTNVLHDSYGRSVYGPYGLMYKFDSESLKVAHDTKFNKNISEGGNVGGNIVWRSPNSKSKLGENNKNFNTYGSDLQEALSTKFGFRQDSILGHTQELLNSLPPNGDSYKHVASVIDQTSRYFKDGDIKISRGHAVQYVSKFNKSDSGVEYGRVWTKDRAYYTMGDSMPLNDVEPKSKVYKPTGTPYRRQNIRRYDGSVLDRTWNLNIAPMSNGMKSFDGSTNIKKNDSGGYEAKKYMFSIENLAWKTSTKSGYTVNDLPYCERGPNGGRVMWFPPYDLSVNEQVNANWDTNTFVGRPEPVYTYNNTNRAATVSFKVVVDHPSILNLLVREHFKGMNDEEADNYINAFFAGLKDVDFYTMMQNYTTLDSNDISLIEAFLNKKAPTKIINTFKFKSVPGTVENKSAKPTKAEKPTPFEVNFYFPNDVPSKADDVTKTNSQYGDILNSYIAGQSQFISLALTDYQNLITTGSTHDKYLLYNTDVGLTFQNALERSTLLTASFAGLNDSFNKYTGLTTSLVSDMKNNLIEEITVTLYATTSELGSKNYNYYLSIRRLESLFLDILNRLSDPTNNGLDKVTWPSKTVFDKYLVDSKLPLDGIPVSFSIKDVLGHAKSEGKINFKFAAAGETNAGSGDLNVDCTQEYQEQNLRITAPSSFYCRQTSMKISYTKKDPNKPPAPPIQPPTKIIPVPESHEVPGDLPKPPIDMMKRVIMKTLSECYYFKKLEEDSPVAFKSLREKLKYFHPGFHSMTPEGLNARLTFLQQCLRPGDTIPIRGLSEATDLNARNTTFGPPPVCVMRIGDFYHSKVIINNLNISFEDNVWDLNPEGIGVQPMIAKVTLQIYLLGGHGLEAPVNKLQNALSSNFYANTEMYDERSQSTATSIGGKKADEFTKKFLEELLLQPQNRIQIPLKEPSKPVQGKYIGEIIPDTQTKGSIDYTNLINSVFTLTNDYFETYKSTYNDVYTKWGSIISSMFLSNTYRTIKEYDLYSGPSTSTSIDLFGEYNLTDYDLTNMKSGFKAALIASIETNNMSDILGFSSFLGKQAAYADSLLKPFIKKTVESKLDSLDKISSLDNLIKRRNKLIDAFDKLNYLIKYSDPNPSNPLGFDVKIDNKKYTKAVLTGFTASSISNEYSNLTSSFFGTNNTILNQNLNTTAVDFQNPTINSATLKVLLGLLLNDQKDNIMALFKDDVLFPPKIKEAMIEILTYNEDPLKNKFIVKPSKVDFTKTSFVKTPTRKSNKGVYFDIGEEIDLTNQPMIDEIIKVFSPKNVLGVKLNLYNHE